MNTDTHEPVPLSTLVFGTLTLHFAGATIEQRMSLAKARTINEINDGRRAADSLDWSDLRWLQFESDKILACHFKPDEDLGYGLTSDERATLTKNGHPHGILRTLVDHWRGRDEPSYSLLALHHLTQFALEGPTGDTLTHLIEALEGDAGRKVLHDAITRTQSTSAQQAHTPSSDSQPMGTPVDTTQDDSPHDSPAPTSPGDEPTTESRPDDD